MESQELLSGKKHESVKRRVVPPRQSGNDPCYLKISTFNVLFSVMSLFLNDDSRVISFGLTSKRLLCLLESNLYTEFY